MPNQETDAAVEQAAEQVTQDFSSIEDAFTAARDAESGLAEEAEVGAEAPAEEDQDPSAPQGKAEEEPEHTRWAKSQNGFADDKGNLNAEALAKQAFELNRQNQSQAQQIAQIRQLISDPEVYKLITEKAQGKKADESKPTEKTDEQVLAEFVAKQMEPLVAENRLLFQQYCASAIQSTMGELQKEFPETDETGAPNPAAYSQMAPEVGAYFANVAANNGITAAQLVEHLVRNNQLTQAFQNVARQVAYNKIVAARPQMAQAAVERKKKAQLPARGAPSVSVKPSENGVDSVQDAYELAKRQLNQPVN